MHVYVCMYFYNRSKIDANQTNVAARYHKKAIKRHMYIGKTFLQLVFDALRARRELDNFLNQFHYGGATKSVVDPRLG